MTETSTFEFWFLLICVAVYAHFLQLSIHAAHGSANDDRPDAEPDLWQPPALVNAVLENAVAVESVLIPRRVPLPFGLSVLAVARAA